MSAAEILAIGGYRNNAELIVAARDLGYIHGRVLDPTWGLGRFWTLWMPDELVPLDLDPVKSPSGIPADFRDLRWARTGEFDTVVLDPPYKLNGRPGRGGPATSDSDYGVDKYRTADQRMQLIRDGITECARVLAPRRRGRPRSHLLLKCQDQVNSGRVVWQTIEFPQHAETVGLRLVDRLDLVGGRAQPPGSRQQHARRNHSTLLVFEVSR